MPLRSSIVILPYLFVWLFPRGAAISLVITNVMAPVILVVYMWARKLHRLTWGGWSWESLREWGQFAKLAIPGVFMTCLPWWTAEATSFVSGAISDTELAVNSVGFQLINIMFMVSEEGV